MHLVLITSRWVSACFTKYYIFGFFETFLYWYTIGQEGITKRVKAFWGSTGMNGLNVCTPSVYISYLLIKVLFYRYAVVYGIAN